MLLFQTEIESIDVEVTQLQERIAEKLRRQEQLKACQEETKGALEVLQNVAKQVNDLAVLSDLRAAVVSLFDSIKNGKEELPASTLSTTSTELEVKTEPEETEVPTKVEATTSSETPDVLNLSATPDSKPEMPNLERVKVNEFVSYETGGGEIECTYVHFNRKDKATSWGKWITSPKVALASKFEVQPALASIFKYELKVWGLNLNQVNRLTEQDFLDGPPKSEGAQGGMTRTALFEPVSLNEADASQTKPIAPDTVAVPKEATPELENLEPGDVIGSLLVPNWTYKVVELKPNHKLQCERILSLGQSFSVELDVSGVYLIEKASQSQKAEQGTAESGTELETVVNTPEESSLAPDEKQEYHLEPSLNSLVSLSATPSSSITAENLAEWLRKARSWEEIEAVVAANEQHKRAAWKLLSQEEQNQVLVLKLQAKQGETQSEICIPSSVTTTPESSAEVTVENFSYGDTIEVISARNGEERVGDVGIVRVVNEHGVTVESNGVLTYWYPEELKLLARSDES
jgi:hypothetical protein